MTAIIAIVDAHGFTFGADSAVSCLDGDDTTYSLDLTDEGKLFENGPMIFGYCGSTRMGQLLEYSLTIPRKKRSQTARAFMATTFIDAVRECLKKGGWAGETSGAIDDDKEHEERAGNFLVGFQRQLWLVEADYQVLSPSDSYTAIGCGSSLVKGAMYALREAKAGLTPLKEARIALRAAERYSAAVRRPFQFKQRPHDS